MTDERKPARPTITRAWVFDGPGGVRIQKAESDSQQLPEDPFSYTSNPKGDESGLDKPPFDMNALAAMLGGPESMGNSLHARCVKQKASDTLGRGIELRDISEDDREPVAEEEDRWNAYVEAVETDDRDDGSLKERLTWMWQDYESIGWGVVESGRKTTGEIDGLWHVPSHTVRAHSDGIRYAQKRGHKLTWFKRFGVKGDVNAQTGEWVPGGLSPEVRGNELIVIKNYSPISAHYGLPDHIPALGAFAGWSAQQAFNVRFFDNQAVPSMAVIVEGADLSPEVEATIYDHFERIKGDPSRTIVIPVPGVQGVSEMYQPKIRFERLSTEIKDASFRMYRQDIALETCIAHGVPPYRIGWPIVGSLGGSTAEEMTKIYNDSIVQPRQETVEQRFNRALLGPNGLKISSWRLKVNELDVRNEMADLERSEKMYSLGVLTPNMIARYFGVEERDPAIPGGDDYITVPLNPQGGAGQGAAAPALSQGSSNPFVDEAVAKYWRDEVSELVALREQIVKAMPELVAA